MTLFRTFFAKPAAPAIVMQGATLADVRPGHAAMLKDFSANISPQRWAHLQAYGLTPGRQVQVVQHRPVTVVRVEYSELALEDELARQIGVESID
jgi:Fe2+ transport system protein FeoA